MFVSSAEDMVEVEVCRCLGSFGCVCSTTCVQLCCCVVPQIVRGVGSLVCHCIGRSCSVVSWRRFGKASVTFVRVCIGFFEVSFVSLFVAPFSTFLFTAGGD